MAAFPIDEAQLVALFMTSVTYGVYLVTVGVCIQVLFWGKHAMKKRLNWPLIGVVVSMFVFATFEAAFSLRHNLDAFIFYKGSGGPDAAFENISNWVNVMKTLDVQMMTLIGDGMLIYRCLVVYSYNWSIIYVPVILWLGSTACSCVITYITATLHSDAILSSSHLSPFVMSFLVLTLVTNVLTTGLIVWRIWRVDRASRRLILSTGTHRERSVLAQAIRIVVESGLLYTGFVLITFLTELTSSNAAYMLADSMTVVTGISFNLIIIRVDRGIAVGQNDGTNTAPPVSIPLSIRFRRTQNKTADLTRTKEFATAERALSEHELCSSVTLGGRDACSPDSQAV